MIMLNSKKTSDSELKTQLDRELELARQEEYRVNKLGQLERFREGQWELIP